MFCEGKARRRAFWKRVVMHGSLFSRSGHTQATRVIRERLGVYASDSGYTRASNASMNNFVHSQFIMSQSDLNTYLEYSKGGIEGYARLKREFIDFLRDGERKNYSPKTIDALIALRASPFYNEKVYGEEYRTLWFQASCNMPYKTEYLKNLVYAFGKE
jgi:hypothetical protein